MKLRKPRGLAIALAMAVSVILTLSLISAAHALTLRLSGYGGTTTISDGDPGDSCPLAGCVTFNGPLGDFIVNVTTGLSGSPSTATLQLSSLNVLFTGPNPDTLLIELTDIGFLPSGGFSTRQLVSTIAGFLSASGSSSTPSQCVGVGAFDCSFATIAHGTFPGPGAYTDTRSTLFSSGTPFSITETVALAFTGSGTSSLSFASTVVPQPRALLLLGLGLAGLWALPMLRASRRGRDD